MHPDSPSLIELKRRVTSDRLSDAALELFGERGYGATTVDDIVRASGLSRATFYLHFKGKLALTLGLLTQLQAYATTRYAELDELLASGAEDTPARLRAWLAEWQEYWSQRSGLFDAISAATNADPALEDWSITSSTLLIDALHRYLSTLSEPDRSTRRGRAVMAEASTRMVLSLSSRGKIDTPREAVLDYLCDLWSIALKPS